MWPLKSADFFDVEKFPTLHFKSTGISIVRDGELSVEGDLTIRGVARKVRFAVEGPTPPTKDPWGGSTRKEKQMDAPPNENLVPFGPTGHSNQREGPKGWTKIQDTIF
jgi:hypothetical protein